MQSSSTHSNFVIGISGPTTSGKTTLAQLLSQRLNCPVVHQDKYFDAQKIKKELDFNCEILEAINQKEFLQEIKRVSMTHKIFIIEGFQIYSSKEVVDLLNLKIYLDINEDIIKQRRMLINPCTIWHFQNRIIPSARIYKQMCLTLKNIKYIDGTMKIKEILQQILSQYQKVLQTQKHIL